MAKLSISIPDDLEQLLEERAAAEKLPVSQVVSKALRAYFALPSSEAPGTEIPTPCPDTDGLRQVQEYLWDLHQSYDRTRSAVLVLHHLAEKNGELVAIPPESSFKKPPWPKPRPRPSTP